MNQNASVDYITGVANRLVESSPLGEELTTDQRTALASIIRVAGLRRGDFLIKEGEVDDSLHVLVTGHLEVVKQDQGGEYVTLHVLYPGEMAGALGFIDGTPHSASLRAMENSEVFVIHRPELESLITEQPELVYKVMRAIVRAVHKTVGRMNFQFVQLTDYICHQHGRF